MKTNEELKAMTHDELVEYAEKLQKDLKSSRDSTLFFLLKKFTDHVIISLPSPTNIIEKK